MSEDLNSRRDLYESERIFRLLVEGVVDYAICMLDPSGIVTNWNAGAAKIKGYSAAEIVGQHFSVFYLPEDRSAGLPNVSIETARRTGRFEAEGWRIRKDGSKFFASVVIDAIYEHGALIGFAKITRDITERQNAKSALDQSESHFRALVSGVTDYALYMIDPTGIVTNWNTGAERIKGYRPEEIIGRHFSVFYTDVDRVAGKPQRALNTAISTGHYHDEALRVRKDGSYFWASVVIDPIYADDGGLLGFAKITRDITERRESEQRLEKIQRQLAESQKLDALGQLTGGVAHDFNNLLMIISGNIRTLKTLAAGNERATRAVQAIETASERGASLTSQLLTFARRQRVNPEPVNLTERIPAVRDVLNIGIGKAIRLEIDIQDDVWPVVVDAAEFETALVNLVINSRDAMPNGGLISIRAKNITIHDDANQGEHVAITVEDDGTGIPPDVVAKVFDPFFTTKAVGKGTGLGLSQVHGFAHQAGGTVGLKSHLGKGTAITICLPKASSTIDRRDPPGSLAGSGTVLVVEDNPDVASVSAGLLEQLGYSVRCVSDAESALKEVEQSGIDLVFSDIVMPGELDGLGLAHRLTQSHPDLPILLVTGYSDSLREAGNEFPILRKPYQLHELSRALAKLFEKRSRII